MSWLYTTKLRNEIPDPQFKDTKHQNNKKQVVECIAIDQTFTIIFAVFIYNMNHIE